MILTFMLQSGIGGYMYICHGAGICAWNAVWNLGDQIISHSVGCQHRFAY